MTETSQVAGIIASVRPWKGGKGYFVGLEDDSNDYYGFGTCKANEGDSVLLSVEPGTGGFSDKVLIKKIEKGKTTTTAPQPYPKAAGLPKVDDAKAGLNIYIDKQRAIIEQSSLKAAARIVAAAIISNKLSAVGEATAKTLRMKDKFVVDIIGGKEEPEEPEAEA